MAKSEQSAMEGRARRKKQAGKDAAFREQESVSL
jgi:hypothetical protein